MVIIVDDLFDKVSTFGLPIIFLSKKNEKSLNFAIANVSFFEDLVKTDSNKFNAPEVNQDDTAALLYSFGTTGASKGVILTHRNFIATALMAGMDQDLRGEGPNTFLCFLPMFHIFGMAFITYAQLVRGNCIVVMSRFEMEMTLKSIERFRVSYLFVVPPVIISLAKSGKVKDYDVSLLRWLGSGAAPLGKDVMEEVSRVFPLAQIVQVMWTFSIYLEVVAILPQLVLLQRTKNIDNLTGQYVFFLGAYRLLYILNWIYRYFTEPHYVHWIAWISGLVQTLLYADFFYYYIIR